ncbi:MAG TPA: GFA family protein [Burkholderiales bacterium]|nr:GFA family protein [Burkholderiales bacterium]
MKIEGGCLCGKVRYVASAEPLVVRACWCRVCQFIASGNATINLAFPADALTVTGELRDFPLTADSGRRMHRRFCPACGVHLFSTAEERPNLVVVRAGTLDDPGIATPQAAIWTRSAPAWAHIDPDLPRFEGQPPPPVSK